MGSRAKPSWHLAASPANLALQGGFGALAPQGWWTPPALWALHHSNCRGLDPLSSWWLYWAISHPNFSTPESAPLRRKQQSNKQKHKFKKEWVKSQVFSKFRDCREVLGHLWQLLVGLLQQSEEHTPFCSSTYLPICRAPWSFCLTCSGHHLSVPTCRLLAGASQLNLLVMAQTAGSISAKRRHFHVFILFKVKVSKKACKYTRLHVGTWMHSHKGCRKTFISRCWVTAVCIVWRFLRNVGRQYLDQIWFSGGLFVFSRGMVCICRFARFVHKGILFPECLKFSQQGEKLQLAL